MTEEKLPRKTRRKLSRFLCQEMLYDYLMERLDPDRAEAVRDFVQADEQIHDELECLKDGLKYSAQLSESSVSAAIMDKLRASEPQAKRILSHIHWRNWPPTFRLGTEAMVLSAIVAGAMSSVPWQKINLFLGDKSKLIEIAKVDAHKKSNTDDSELSPDEKVAAQPQSNPEAEQMKIARAEKEISKAEILPDTDEASDDHEEPVVPETVKAGPTHPPEKAEPVAKEAVPAPKSSEMIAVAPTPINPPVAKVDQVASSKSEEDDDKGPPPSVRLAPGAKPVQPGEIEGGAQGHLKGLVYKAFMKLSKLDEMTPKIADLVRNFGGERAGEVELGWRRESGSYYHFTLPETNYEDLLTKLQEFGTVQIYREPHRRVMPKGKIRFILWVEDGDK